MSIAAIPTVAIEELLTDLSTTSITSSISTITTLGERLCKHYAVVILPELIILQIRAFVVMLNPRLILLP